MTTASLTDGQSGPGRGSDAPSPPAERHAILTEDTLAAFLDVFYGKVRRDDRLGPVFARHVADLDWPRHLETIRDFWSSVLLRSGRYKGNPFGRHLGVAGIDLDHFSRWLGLFAETAQERFAPEIAAALSERADRIGESLKAGLFFRPRTTAPRHEAQAVDHPRDVE